MQFSAAEICLGPPYARSPWGTPSYGLYGDVPLDMVGFSTSLPKQSSGDTPYKGLYGEVPPERGIFFRLQVYERVGILLNEVYERVGKSVIWVRKRTEKGLQLTALWLLGRENLLFFVIDSYLNECAFTEVKSDASSLKARYVKGPIVEKVYERGTFFREKWYIKG